MPFLKTSSRLAQFTVSQRRELSYRCLINKSWPVILANAAVPLLGLTDTAVIGHVGSTSELAGLAVAALLFNFIYWTLGFLRMGTTAHVAKLDGDNRAIAVVLAQSALIALCLALLILLAQRYLLLGGLQLLAPPAQVGATVEDYFQLRIWAAPAVLLNYIALGYFIGSGHSRTLLFFQLLLNVSNAVLDILFAVYFDWGLKGIALGTVIAEYVSAALALVVVIRRVKAPCFLALKKAQLFEQQALLALFSQNRDLFIRTLFLLLGFALFTHIGGSFGEATLAANHLLLQFLAFAAFFLDGYAYVLEAYAGRALGRGNWLYLREALVRTSLLALVTALLLALVFYGCGPSLALLFTDKSDVLALIPALLPFLALYVLLAVAAYQFDGLFIGAGFASAMRNCSLISFTGFAAVYYGLGSAWLNLGLWWAFIAFALFRAVSLALYLPALKQRILTYV
ncbi:MATE family efflux transporter [Agaribacterium haliotis]|uniref:MATE family efflux transporter n=1 Tax=Agaribacterium haliotis TaxID=2013869 RepID=UPI00130407DC|nr:MATE family efflux transporter [Agaribacterium haliotis]